MPPSGPRHGNARHNQQFANICAADTDQLEPEIEMLKLGADARGENVGQRVDASDRRRGIQDERPSAAVPPWVRSNLRAAVDLHFAHYNMVRLHRTTQIIPAMAAGVSDRLWTLEELVESFELRGRTDGR